MNEKIKKPFYKRIWFIALVVIIGISVIGGSGSDEGSTKTASDKKTEEKQEEKQEEAVTYHVGDVVTVGDVEYTVNSISTQKEVGNDYLKETAKGTYIIINVSVTNNGNEELMVDSSLFTLVNGEKEYGTDSGAALYVNEDASFFLENINPDLTLTGNIVFDVSDEVIASEELQLQVQTGFWGTETELIYLNK